MSSKLQGTSLRINDTQEIVKIKTSVNNTNDEVPTSGAVKDLIDSLIPVTLEVEGDWTNKQVRYRIPDPAGLSFKVTYKNGNTVYAGAQLSSPNAWPGVGLQTATFSYTENGVTIYGTRSVGIELLPVSLTITGDWVNYQYAGLAPDPDGLTFTVTYDDDSTAVVSGLTVTPGTWGNTEGTQTATFSYSQTISSGTVTVTASKDANVVRKPTSLTITGNLNDNYQFYNNPPNLTGLTFEVSYSNGTTKTVLPSDIGFNISPDTWGGMGQQTATFSYTENGATVTKTQTANVVKKPSSLSIESGSLSDNYQYTKTAPNASTLRFKVYYNDGTNEEKATSSIAITPSTWSSTAGQQTATFSYTENGVTVSISRNATVVRKLTGLSISGSWSKTQYTNTAVDYTGLTFTASYNNNTSATVTPSDYNPKIWSSTVGSQTCTFYYSESGITVSTTSPSVNVEVPWKTVPLTLQARGAGNISITKTGDPGTIYYSKNGGSQTALDSSVNIPVSAGDKVSFYRTLSGNLSYGNHFTINCTNNCYVYGNVMSLHNRNNFSNLTTIQYEYAFSKLFYENNYVNIDESVGKLLLPATTLAERCYSQMFDSCSSLTTTPVLPATTLTKACYHSMFNYCTSLTTAPTLPATKLADLCYYNMFDFCISLTTAPALPATTLTEECYSNMFNWCTSLTTAPTLPATILTRSCYTAMFYNCTSLTSITCLATNISASDCTYHWVSKVASSGTFYKNSAMSSWTTGNDGIPSGWTVRNA